MQCDCSLKHQNKGVCNCLESSDILDMVSNEKQNEEQNQPLESDKVDGFKGIQDQFEDWPSNIEL